MQDLTLVGLTEDGTALILVGETGERYKVPADARLRAALRTDQTRPGQGEKKMDSVLRPRDIQTRIRFGESPESVAEAARTTVDKIMGFAAPVLAERAYVADQAQKASIRRRAGEGPVAHLGEAVAQRLRSAKVDPGGAEWDAWRRDDGRWTLVVDYDSAEGPQRAEFVYDAAGRYVIAENDQSRWLVGERASAGQAAQGRRLTSVDDGQLPLGEDAIEVVTGRRPADAPLQLTFDDAADDGDSARGGDRSATPAPTPRSPEPAVDDDSLTEDLSEIAEAVRPDRGTPGRSADADWISTQASERAARPSAPAAQPAADADAGDSAEPEPEPESTEPAAPKRPARTKGQSKGKGRASVPSWDEIMFGSGRND